MGTKFGVIIPMIDSRLTDNVLRTILLNTVQPHNIVIIDNSDEGNYKPDWRLEFLRHVNVTILEQKGLPVNQSWKAGMAALDGKADLITILNDDVLLGPKFFQRLVDPFQIIDCACLCPLTYGDASEFENNLRLAPDEFDLEIMKKREGWAFTFRADVLRSLPPIPDELATYCGDDWLFYFTRYQGKRWYKDNSNMVFHAVGASTVQRPEVRETMEAEKLLYHRLVAAYLSAHERREGN